jgi:hypothetical protein
MKNVLLMIRNGAFAVGIAVALCFGAAEALSGPPGLSWRPVGLVAAADTICQKPDPCDTHDDCEITGDICTYPPYYGGSCLYDQGYGYKCCVCFE